MKVIDVSKFEKKHLDFIEDEFGVTAEQLKEYSRDEWHELRMKCFDIECSEIGENDECSEKGEVAADIVSKLYADIKVR